MHSLRIEDFGIPALEGRIQIRGLKTATSMPYLESMSLHGHQHPDPRAFMSKVFTRESKGDDLVREGEDVRFTW